MEKKPKCLEKITTYRLQHCTDYEGQLIRAERRQRRRHGSRGLAQIYSFSYHGAFCNKFEESWPVGQLIATPFFGFLHDFYQFFFSSLKHFFLKITSNYCHINSLY
jgi:hypothetical protein